MSAKSDRLEWEKKQTRNQAQANRDNKSVSWRPKDLATRRVEFRTDSLERRGHADAMALQGSVNAGNLAVTNRQQLGFTKRTGMAEFGATNRQGMAGESNLALQRSRNAGGLDRQFNADQSAMNRLKFQDKGLDRRQAAQIASGKPAHDLAVQKARFGAGEVTGEMGETSYSPIRTKMFDALGGNKSLDGGPGFIPQEKYDAINNAPVKANGPASPVKTQVAAVPAKAKKEVAPSAAPVNNSRALESFRDFSKPGLFSVGGGTNAALNSGSDFLKRYNEKMKRLYRQP